MQFHVKRCLDTTSINSVILPASALHLFGFAYLVLTYLALHLLVSLRLLSIMQLAHSKCRWRAMLIVHTELSLRDSEDHTQWASFRNRSATYHYCRWPCRLHNHYHLQLYLWHQHCTSSLLSQCRLYCLLLIVPEVLPALSASPKKLLVIPTFF